MSQDEREVLGYRDVPADKFLLVTRPCSFIPITPWWDVKKFCLGRTYADKSCCLSQGYSFCRQNPDNQSIPSFWTGKITNSF